MDDNFINKIIGFEKYKLFAVLISIVEFEGIDYFLFQKRAKNIRQGGEISFPGGEFDENMDNDLKETAFRETFEEMGVSKDKIEIIKDVGYLISPSSIIIKGILGKIKIKSLDEINYNNEVEEIFIIPISKFNEKNLKHYFVNVEFNPHEIEKNGDKKILFNAKELKLPNRYHKSWRGNKVPIKSYEIDDRIIWGITADLIYEVVSKEWLKKNTKKKIETTGLTQIKADE
ncbi:NUDIX hydrolase [Haliovirga abyssi]|uniref:DNA mismatch repair protein MutT n=1 Tax=Haliovirga abyssi TaxID=2996794 RepID=A0AAU9E4T7_9FUSO|nr:NUDIX domain-containing protein [Haliovirga abyssi]BDU51540.1 DNA mismatch repair protein MutT [Haliovirga abyssi]